jgi:dehydrogenase/reductase SDR family member 4
MTDIVKLKDKVVLITGSTKGIGKVIAESFAEQGAKIVINSEIRNDVETTVREFKEKKYSVTGISADVGEVEDVSVMTFWLTTLL